MSAGTKTRVFETAIAARAREQRRKEQPLHWVNSKGTVFKNPYPSWRRHDAQDMRYLMFELPRNYPTVPKNITELIPVRKPDWGAGLTGHTDQLKATWLGHSSFLVSFPTRTANSGEVAATRGINVLFDPIFSERCSPFQWIGPKRCTPSPCQVDDLPDIDAVVISHDHYDHLDANTIKALYRRPCIPQMFTPIGYASLVHSFGIPATHHHELDWWDTRRLEIEVPAASSADSPVKLSVDITATPSQHNTSRSISDKMFDFHRLWASWVVQEVFVSSSESNLAGKTVFFGGDTGYRAVLDGQDENTVPTFPGFKEIGQRFGEIELALIPVGAYEGRRFMSGISKRATLVLLRKSTHLG